MRTESPKARRSRRCSMPHTSGPGTGSYPPRVQGWQRAKRPMVRRSPRAAPWRSSASTPNAEQLGTNRQEGGSAGASTNRYARSNAMSATATTSGRRLSARGRELQGARELGGHMGIGEFVRAWPCDDDHVARRRERRAVASKDLAHEALDTVPDGRIANPAADRDAQPREIARCGATDHHEVSRVAPPALALDAQELHPPTQPRRLGEALPSHGLNRAAFAES